MGFELILKGHLQQAVPPGFKLDIRLESLNILKKQCKDLTVKS